MQKILIVDDKQDLVSLVKEWLEEGGYEVYTATNGMEGLRLSFQHKPVLSIIDLRMPGMDGFTLITRIRDISDAYIMVLSALSAEEHIIRALGLGADTYVTKPTSRLVFLARVRAMLRRAVPPDKVTVRYSDDFLTLNLLTHEIQVRGSPQHLRPTEFRLLSFLVQNRGRVVSHHEILDSVWGVNGSSFDSLKWYISSLREKVEENPQNPRLIVTIPRVGYRYMPPQDSAEKNGHDVTSNIPA